MREHQNTRTAVTYQSTQNAPSLSAPLKRVLAMAVVLAAVALGARLYAAPSAERITDLRSADADAWQALRAGCVDRQAPGRDNTEFMEQCTTYADDALHAARREGVSLSAYVRSHGEELKRKVEEASNQTPPPRRRAL